MSAPRAELVVAGRVVLAAEPGGLETAEAIGIIGGRVVSAGTRADVTDGAAPGARLIDAGGAAVIPGLHDFHIHLVGLARTRGAIALDDASDGAEVASRLAEAALRGAPDAWLTGRGWSERHMAGIDAGALDAAAGRPAGVPDQPRRALGLGLARCQAPRRHRRRDRRSAGGSPRARRRRGADRHPARDGDGPRGAPRGAPAGRLRCATPSTPRSAISPASA